MVAVLAVGTPASAVEIGMEGCTPGYWKNHTDNWEEYQPDQQFGSVFASAPASVAGATLEESLSFSGGSGVDGAARILARAATASLLNAAHEGLGFPWRRNGAGLDGRPALIAEVNAAFESGDREEMLALATWLDQDNNLGCTLS